MLCLDCLFQLLVSYVFKCRVVDGPVSVYHELDGTLEVDKFPECTLFQL